MLDIFLFTFFEGFKEMDLEEIKEEIKNYPTPIAGCDVYFNWLLEERDSCFLEKKKPREEIIMQESSDCFF